MKPYFDDGQCVIYHGDARELMPLLTWDVWITDPPYGVAYKSGRAGSLPRSIQGDEDTSLRDWMLYEVGEKPGACFATWRCIPPVRPRGCLVWGKNINSMGDLGFPWGNNFEMVWVYGQGWAGKRTSAVLKGRTVVTWNTGKAKRLHPHEKPVDLLEQILHKAPLGIVLDPFMGSGTALVAAKNLGRRAVGIEIEERYCEVAAKRLSQQVLDLGEP